ARAGAAVGCGASVAAGLAISVGFVGAAVAGGTVGVSVGGAGTGTFCDWHAPPSAAAAPALATMKRRRVSLRLMSLSPFACRSPRQKRPLCIADCQRAPALSRPRPPPTGHV